MDHVSIRVGGSGVRSDVFAFIHALLAAAASWAPGLRAGSGLTRARPPGLGCGLAGRSAVIGVSRGGGGAVGFGRLQCLEPQRASLRAVLDLEVFEEVLA